MRILHVLDHSIPLHSGYTFRTCAIIKHQRALGWETFHVTSPKHIAQGMEEERIDGLHFYRTPPAAGWQAKLPVVNQIAVIRTLRSRLEEIVESIEPDLIHAHSPALNGVAAVSVGRRHALPVVYEVRAFWEDAAVDHGTSRPWGPRYRLTRGLESYVLKRANAVSTICEGLRKEIVARGIAADKVHVIPNAVDVEQFGADLCRDPALGAELDLDGCTVLGFIGSFYAYEGLSLLLRALPAISANAPGVRLLLVGGGPEEKKLRALASNLRIGEKVVFTGRVPHDEVSRYYSLVDMFVYPRFSMRLTELVTPLKPLEAMAQGRIVVASDVGGHRELIDDGKNGWLFSPGDPAAIAECVLGVLRSAKQWPAVKARARRFVESERSWPVSVARYRPLYDRLLGAGEVRCSELPRELGNG